MQIYELDRQAISQHAQIAREREQSRGSGEGDIKWYDWKNGENVLRLTVPYSARGRIFKEVGKHYDIPALQEGAQEKNPLCFNITFSEIPGIVCPYCSAMEAITQQIPGFSVSDFRPSRNGYTWVIDRRAMDVGPQLARFPAGVFDWVMIQLDNVEWDIANINNGVDIHITKTGAGKKGTKYVPTLSPQRSALAPNEQVLAFWLSKIKDLDTVFKLPEGADLDIHTARSQKFFQMLQYKAKQREEAQKNQSMGTFGTPLPGNPPPAPVGHTGYPIAPQPPGMPPLAAPTVSVVPTAPGVPAPVAPPPPAVPVATAPPPPAVPVPTAPPAPVAPSATTTAAPPPPTFPQTAAATPPAPTPLAPAAAPPAAPPAPVVPTAAPPPPVAVQPPAPAQPTPPAPAPAQPAAAPAAPPVNTAYPDCWGGSVPHADGKLGYQATESKCLTCQHEFTCTDELAKRVQAGQVKI